MQAEIRYELTPRPVRMLECLQIDSPLRHLLSEEFGLDEHLFGRQLAQGSHDLVVVLGYPVRQDLFVV